MPFNHLPSTSQYEARDENEFWKIVNDISKHNSETVWKLVNEVTTLTDDAKIAKVFNSFFVKKD